MLDFRKFAAAKKRTRVQIGDDPEDVIYLRAISARQRVELFDAFRERLGSKTGSDNLDFQMAVIRATVCDESGELVVDDAAADALRDNEQTVFAQISDAAMTAAGFRDDAGKNSVAPPSDVSPSA